MYMYVDTLLVGFRFQGCARLSGPGLGTLTFWGRAALTTMLLGGDPI